MTNFLCKTIFLPLPVDSTRHAHLRDSDPFDALWTIYLCLFHESYMEAGMWLWWWFHVFSFVALKAYLGTIFKIDDSKGTNIIAGGARRRLRFSTTCYLRWSVVAMENQSLTGLCYLI